jgi:signal peptidase
MELGADALATRSRCAPWRRVAGFGGLALCALLAVTMLLPALFGLKRYVVTGGSMGASIPRGSVAFERPVAVSRLRVGDVITYTPPPGYGVSGRVTHRVVWIGRDRSLARAFRTKGDANAAPDPWRFALARPTQARVLFHVPLVGYLLAALAIRLVRIAVIGLPALLVAVKAVIA